MISVFRREREKPERRIRGFQREREQPERTRHIDRNREKPEGQETLKEL